MPFRQDVDFFLKRGAKELDRNDPLAAIQHYRKAYDSDPADLDSCLALAELLSQMHCIPVETIDDVLNVALLEETDAAN